MTDAMPAGRIAFYIAPDTHEIHYSVVKVTGRYADQFEVLELPRGEPDDFYIHASLPESDPHYRIVVERSKEHQALQKLGIDEEGDARALLAAHGYRHERTEALEEAGMRELQEEQGFSHAHDATMEKQLITMRPFPVKANYGSPTEYRSFLQIEGDITQVELHETNKIEKKSPKRLGVPYVEKGGWATLRDIRQNIADFTALAEAQTGEEAERFQSELRYQKSIADWMEAAEAALVGVLRGQRVPVQTSSAVDPTTAFRLTGAAVSSAIAPGR